jgi:C4-dicarboxylate-specific signal transduction histidine kinase
MNEPNRLPVIADQLHFQKMRSVGTLAGGVAHQFNNILAGIQGYAALGLRQPGLSPELARFLKDIVALADRGANLTRQLLTFARKPVLTRYPINLPGLLSETAAMLRQTMDVKVELPEPIGDGQPLRVLADASQLQQVLVSLAQNARDALAQPEPIHFRLESALLDDFVTAFPEDVPPGDYALVEIRDHGQGMTSEVLEHAFDPFFTTKELGQRAGLGLPVAWGITQGHDGHLTLDSSENQGTTVRLYLPRLAE